MSALRAARRMSLWGQSLVVGVCGMHTQNIFARRDRVSASGGHEEGDA